MFRDSKVQCDKKWGKLKAKIYIKNYLTYKMIHIQFQCGLY